MSLPKQLKSLASLNNWRTEEKEKNKSSSTFILRSFFTLLSAKFWGLFTFTPQDSLSPPEDLGPPSGAGGVATCKNSAKG